MSAKRDSNLIKLHRTEDRTAFLEKPLVPKTLLDTINLFLTKPISTDAAGRPRAQRNSGMRRIYTLAE